MPASFAKSLAVTVCCHLASSGDPKGFRLRRDTVRSARGDADGGGGAGAWAPMRPRTPAADAGHAGREGAALCEVPASGTRRTPRRHLGDGVTGLRPLPPWALSASLTFPTQYWQETDLPLLPPRD